MCDNYDVKNVLGRGTFGTVYLAERKDGTKVAIKTGISEMCRIKNKEINSGNITFFEYDILCRLNHPTITRASDLLSPGAFSSCIKDSGTAIVLDLAEMDLHKYIKNKIMDVPLEQMFLQLAIGVQALHTAGYYHLDIKPANYLVYRDKTTNQPVFKINDFGLSVDSSVPFYSYRVGTLSYMAPEVAIPDSQVSNKSDIYSLGKTFIEILLKYLDIFAMPIIDSSDDSDDKLQIVEIFNDFYSQKYELIKTNYNKSPLLKQLFSSVSVVEMIQQTIAIKPEVRPDINEVVRTLATITTYNPEPLITIQSNIEKINMNIIPRVIFQFVKQYFAQKYPYSSVRMFFHCVDLMHKVHSKLGIGSPKILLLACSLISRDIHMFGHDSDYAGAILGNITQKEIENARVEACNLVKTIMNTPELATQLNSPLPIDTLDNSQDLLPYFEYDNYLNSYDNLAGQYLMRNPNGIKNKPLVLTLMGDFTYYSNKLQEYIEKNTEYFKSFVPNKHRLFIQLIKSKDMIITQGTIAVIYRKLQMEGYKKSDMLEWYNYLLEYYSKPQNEYEANSLIFTPLM